MKDKQIAPAIAEPRIFLVSALLHCLSMTVLVGLRSSFGYGYLRPKSIFLACSWAFSLYAVYAWIDGEVWEQQRILLVFGAVAMLLYWTHLVVAFAREWQQTGAHDQYSGTSHLVWLLRQAGRAPTARFETRLHLWGEPLILLLFAGTLWFFLDSSRISKYLCVVAVCLWCKEALNYWYRLRQQKRQRDVYDDTEETVEPPPSNPTSEPPRAIRKVKVKRSRITES